MTFIRYVRGTRSRRPIAVDRARSGPLEATTPVDAILPVARVNPRLSMGAERYGEALQRDALFGDGPPLRSIMTSPVRVIEANRCIETGRRIMLEGAFHHLPVVDEQGKLTGMLADRDILRWSIDAPSERPVGEVMSADIVAADGATRARDAVLLMLEHAIRSLPVVNDQDEVIGIVTTRDILRWVAHETLSGRA